MKKSLLDAFVFPEKETKTPTKKHAKTYYKPVVNTNKESPLYGLTEKQKAVLRLLVEFDGQIISRKEISDSTGVPLSSLSQIVSKFKNCKIVKSVVRENNLGNRYKLFPGVSEAFKKL
jgi:DNA-binding MarR family transcriptional regulator